ncbi:MAG: NAD-dependent epimerase/dehydratase family protein, partial [Candidatus Hodarchaeales archaeon]
RTPSKAEGIEKKYDNLEIVQGNLIDHRSLEKATKDVDAVIHVASLLDIHSKWKLMEQVNITGTEVLINALKSGSKFVLTSSAGVYGFPNKKEKLTEEFEKTSDKYITGPYQKSKKIQENRARDLCQARNIKFAAIRPWKILGPRDYYTLPKLYENILKKQVLLLRGGESLVSIAHVSDVATAHLLALKQIDSIDGEAFHVATSHPTMKQYLDALCEGFGLDPITRSAPYWLIYLLVSVVEFLPIKSDLNRFAIKLIGTTMELDDTKITQQLGFKPKFDFERTIRDSIEWFMRENPQARDSQ